jgi:hypothetical protein
MNEQSLINRAEEILESYAAGDPLDVIDAIDLIIDMLENIRESRD